MEETGTRDTRQPSPFAGQDRGGVRDGGESLSETADPQNNTGASDESAGKELLCTICGLRACWQ